MNLLQGKDFNSTADQLSQTTIIQEILKCESNPNVTERTKENLDELLNFIKLKHYLLDRNYRSFHLKIAPNTYYTWELG